MKAFDTDILKEIFAGNPAYAERIAASCVVSSAMLVTRNRRDFQSIPGLSVEFWD
jgi:hypothetical protein